MQLSLLPASQDVVPIDLGSGCVAWLEHGFVPDHDGLQQRLDAELPWLQEVYRRGARTLPAPRLTSYHGDPGTGYAYSGIAHAPNPWTEPLSALRARVVERVGVALNAVLVNRYRSGGDGMGYHADDEPELGPAPHDIVIACVSLGDTRRFLFKARRGDRRQAVELTGGSLLLMRGETQRRWLHALPKTRRPVGPRTSLTFRVIGGGRT